MSIHDLEEHVIEAAERWAAAFEKRDILTSEEAALLDAVEAIQHPTWEENARPEQWDWDELDDREKYA